jgi:cytochrome c556
MSDEFDIMRDILTRSVKKHGGEKPLTLGHLLNIMNLASKIHEKKEAEYEANMQNALNEIWQDQHKYGTD